MVDDKRRMDAETLSSDQDLAGKTGRGGTFGWTDYREGTGLDWRGCNRRTMDARRRCRSAPGEASAARWAGDTVLSRQPGRDEHGEGADPFLKFEPARHRLSV